MLWTLQIVLLLLQWTDIYFLLTSQETHIPSSSWCLKAKSRSIDWRDNAQYSLDWIIVLAIKRLLPSAKSWTLRTACVSHIVVGDFEAAPGTFGCEIPSLEVRVDISTSEFGPFPSLTLAPLSTRGPRRKSATDQSCIPNAGHRM